MDLRQYYRKIRDVESSIPDKYPLVTSLKTDDGGKAGVVAEVPRYEAARMIVEAKARLATDEEKQAHHDKVATAHQALEEWETARRMQFDLLLHPDRIVSSKPKQSTR